ncbi:MAG: hypothetical protein HYR96_05050 [Deltaproteobacteria bacterium]|nr:hypothetical protein [Deltaproteobacteria bacterium]MBI3294546.1 hypothetical protein [Deltaproteobacteria bacterium]
MQTQSLNSLNEEAILAMAHGADGSILAAGYTTSDSTRKDFAIMRFLSNGQLDPAFGNAQTPGKVVTPVEFGNFIHDDVIHHIFVQQSGKIVVLGGSNLNTTGDAHNFVAIRYSVNGTVDSTFGTSGLTLTHFGPYNNVWAHAALSFKDDKFIIAGASGGSGGNCGYYSGIGLAKYLEDGALDSSFGQNGIFQDCINVSNLNPRIFAIDLQPSDGKLVLAGCSYSHYDTCGNAWGSTFVGARFHSNGTLDTSFGNNGVINATLGFPSGLGMRAVRVQSDGKLLMAGRNNAIAGASEIILARFAPDGKTLDTTFGQAGLLMTQVYSKGSRRIGIDLEGGTDKILITGSASPAGGLAVARYLSSGSLDSTFGTNGIVQISVPETTDSSGLFLLQDASNPVFYVGGQAQLPNNSSDFEILRFIK